MEPGRLNFVPNGCLPHLQRHLPSPPVVAQSALVLTFSQAPLLVPSAALPVGGGWQNQPPHMQRSIGHMAFALKPEQLGPGGCLGAGGSVAAVVGGGVAEVVVGESHDSADGVPNDGLGMQMMEPGRLYFVPNGCLPHLQRHLPSPPVVAQSALVLTFSQAPLLVPSAALPVGGGWQNQPPQMQLSVGHMALLL